MSRHWDNGIEWKIAGERAARLEREDQLRAVIARAEEAEADIEDIEELKEENERLRQALEDILRHYEMISDPRNPFTRMSTTAAICRKALGVEPAGGGK